MSAQRIFEDFLRYTIGIGMVLGGIVVGAANLWMTIPHELLALALMAPGLLIAPFLFAKDTGLSTIDEGAEAGFLTKDPSQYRVAEIRFPGRLQLGFVMVGLFAVGLILILVQ